MYGRNEPVIKKTLKQMTRIFLLWKTNKAVFCNTNLSYLSFLLSWIELG